MLVLSVGNIGQLLSIINKAILDLTTGSFGSLHDFTKEGRVTPGDGGRVVARLALH